MQTIRPAWLIVFGAVYTIGYLFLTLMALGPEPKGGTPVFVPPILTWPLVLVGLFVLKNAKSLSKKIFFVLIMVCHYAITFSIVPQFASGFVKSWSEIWRINSGFIIFTTCWYFFGQLMMWVYFLYQATRGSTNADQASIE